MTKQVPVPGSLGLAGVPGLRLGCDSVGKETVAMPPRLSSISADLGTLKAPWVAWCAKQKIKPSDALRQILTKVLGQTPPGRSVSCTTVPHRAERVTKRMELRLTPSEHAALVARAKAEGVALIATVGR